MRTSTSLLPSCVESACSRSSRQLSSSACSGKVVNSSVQALKAAAATAIDAAHQLPASQHSQNLQSALLLICLYESCMHVPSISERSQPGSFRHSC